MTLMCYARKGKSTPEMEQVAAEENVSLKLWLKVLQREIL